MSDEQPPARRLAPGQTARIRVWERDGTIRTVHETADVLFEAPNWTPDGRLLVNGDGRLWLLPAVGGAPPVAIDAPDLPAVNNDHVLSPDGATVYASANDWHIWALPLEGGHARRLTADDGALHFLHGVHPDGSRLAYVRLQPDGDDWWASATIRTMAAEGGDDRAVTTHPGPADGCAWTPDGAWILFNTEQFGDVAGHAQIARVRDDGSELEQLTHDERVNWFPHAAPTGDLVVYLSFPPGTTGHPADLPVELRLVEGGDWARPRTIVRLHGGQGTINVPSWAPDGSGFAFVDYPLADG
ncbi:TolB family protein [Microbacterium sp. NPDC055683]